MADSGPRAVPDGGDDFGRIEELLRSLSDEDLVPLDPPAHVWAGIEAALAAEAADPVTEPGPESMTSGTVGPDGADGPLPAPVPLDSRRVGRLPRWLAAAAAVVVVAGGAAVLLQQSDDPPVVASAELSYDAEQFDPLGSEASARVSLVEDDGRLRVAFDEASLPAELIDDADLELWLIEPDSEGQVSDLRSLGVVDVDDLDSFPVPDDVDPDRFRVVDISIEPRDGDPTHSGRSILRGAFEAT